MKLILKILAALLILGFLVVSCEPTDKYGDELVCDQPVGPMSLEVVILSTPEVVEQKYRDYLMSKGKRVNRGAERDAFCILRSDNSRVCYLPKLRGQRDKDLMRLWGHEFAHVVCGDWHDPDFVWK